MNNKLSGTSGVKLKDGERRVISKDHNSLSIKGSKSKAKKKYSNVDDIVIISILEKFIHYLRNVEDNEEHLRNLTARLLNYLKNLEVPKKLNEGWTYLVTILKTSKDPETIRNVVQIINNQLTSRQGYRAVCNILINLDITDALLESLFVANGAVDKEALMLEIHTVIANVATKDPDFAYKVKKIGSMKLTITLMKSYTERLLQLRPILLVLKLATSEGSSTSYYGKLGVLPLLLTLVNSLGRSQSTTLKLVLEILAQLTRSKYNGREVIAQSGVRLLFNQLETWEKTDGLNKMKILRAILTCLNNLTELKVGRNAIYDVEGLGHLYRFCHALPALSDYDWIISLATIVAHRCLPPKWLPIDNVCGIITSRLPANIPLNAMLRGDKESFDVDDDEVVSSSDEDELVSKLDSIKYKSALPADGLSDAELEFYKTFLPENELENCFTGNKALVGVVSQTRRSSSPIRTYEDCSFGDLQDVLSCISLSKRSKDFTHSQPSSKRGSFESQQKFTVAAETSTCSSISHATQTTLHICDEKNRVDNFTKDFNFAETQKNKSAITKHLAPFIKIAYPELTADKYFPSLEPLHQKNFSLCREMLLKNLDSLYGGITSKKVVYDYDALIEKECFFSSCNQLTNDDLQRLGTVEDLSGTLHFESRFECGNLRRAIMLGSHDYELLLNPDINTDHHHQWFYFEVSNMEAGIPYNFYITNCEKNNSQFNFGMKPLLYSVREANLGRAYWLRSGRDICYFRNYYSCPPGSKGSTYFTTHFTITFPHPRDVCYIAYHFPYSYSLLQTHLNEWENCHDRNAVFFRKQVLCNTLGGNEVPIITITSNSNTNLEKRQQIFLTSRVHPGETNASWVMKGTIDFLLSDRPSADSVRENFIFKIIPMLNPDGVINGSHRCSLGGMDLNRCWLNPDKNFQPTIYHAKSLIKFLKSIGRMPLVYCDYHGHSRRKNIFVYGCNSKLSWLPEDRLNEGGHCEVLPKLLYQLAPAFSLNNCCFTVEQNRESTARVTLWRELDLKFSYTMESSYCGCDQGPYKDCHLGIPQLREMGTKLCQAILHLQAKNKSCNAVLSRIKKYENQINKESDDEVDNEDNDPDI